MAQPQNTIPCIDVSSAQGVVNWPAVYASGVRAVYVEHGVGNDAGNAHRAAQVTGAQAAGLLVGRYDFLYPIGLPGAGRDPQGQAARHAALAVPGVTYDLPDAVDLEWPEPPQWPRWGCSASQIVQWVLAYSIARPSATRIYVAPVFLALLGHPPELGRFDLWLAAWSGIEPEVPPPWAAWAAWQHSSTGNVQGIDGPVDLSWLRVSPAPPPPPPAPPPWPSEIATRPDLPGKVGS